MCLCVCVHFSLNIQLSAPACRSFTLFTHTHTHTHTHTQTQTNQSQALARIVDFLGLCPFNFTEPIVPLHVTNNKVLEEDGMVLEEEVIDKLRLFYEPYNRQLYELIGRDLGWGEEEEEG